jgi:NADPH2:quinone reductase
MAAPINPSDLAFLAGHYQSNKKFPTVPGFEGAGIVVENGGGLIGWNLVGKRVAAFGFKAETGSYSQYAIVDATSCV